MNNPVTASHKIPPMPRPMNARKNKPQARTEATKTKVLDAAQSLFAEMGFENTQLDEVASRAGCSRGAIYAHYASKEELFLALIEQRLSAKFMVLCKKLEQEPDVDKRLCIFKRWVTAQLSGSSWGTLSLEFKLYAVRRPELAERLLNLYNSMFRSDDRDLVEILFGNDLTKSNRMAVKRRLAVMGGALSAMVLESHFRPALLPAHHVQQLAEEFFDAFIHP